MALGDNTKEIKGQGTKIQSTSGLSYYLDNDYLPKHITVDLGGQETVKVGAVLSSRQQLKVLDEKGETVEGFFTADEFVDEKQLFKSRVSSIKIPEGYNDLQSAHEQLADKVKADAFFRQVCQRTGGVDITLPLSKDDKAKFISKLGNVSEYLKTECGFPSSFCNDLKKKAPKQEHVDYVIELAKTALNAGALTDAHIKHQKQTEFSNINRRNTAARDLADLAGLSYLIPKTTSMTIRNGDQVMHGNFMEKAKASVSKN